MDSNMLMATAGIVCMGLGWGINAVIDISSHRKELTPDQAISRSIARIVSMVVGIALGVYLISKAGGLI